MTIRLNGSTSGYVELDAPAVAGTTVLELPTDSIKPGMVLVASQSFSAVSSVSVNNCFTATYDSYKIVISSLRASASSALYARVRASGSDNSASEYVTLAYFVAGLSAGVYRVAPNSYWDLGLLNSGFAFGCTVELQGPRIAENTNGSFNTSGRNSTPDSVALFGGIAHYVSSAFDGLTLYPSTGNITGTVRIYGLRNSV